MTEASLQTHMDSFIQKHGVPESYGETWIKHIQPLARWIEAKKGGEPLIVGINGAQGSGKTTLAAALGVMLSSLGFKVARLSLDDLYFTKKERAQLARDVHPLLQTRGVPGTHDVDLGVQTITQLISGVGEVCIPRFDKALDDRANVETWPRCETPVDIVLFEGWCVATPAQPEQALKQPINDLESIGDKDGIWRRYVNTQLATVYPSLFDNIDVLLFLQAPDFESILRWRMHQEQQTFSNTTQQGMDEQAMTRFIQHFERLSRVAFAQLPQKADRVLKLNHQQRIIDVFPPHGI